MLLPFQQKSMFAEDADEDGFEAVMASGRMVIRGDVIGRAYIAPGSTVATAQKVPPPPALVSLALDKERWKRQFSQKKGKSVWDGNWEGLQKLFLLPLPTTLSDTALQLCVPFCRH